MRIAFTSYEYSPYISGGIGNYTRQAANMLKRRGHDVEIFSASPFRCYSDNIDGVNVNYVTCENRENFKSAVVKGFSEKNTENKFDIVECPDLGAEGLEIFQRWPKIPSVVRLHTPLYLASWVDRQSFGKTAVALQTFRIGVSEIIKNQSLRKANKFFLDHWSLSSSYDLNGDIERQAAVISNLLVSPSVRLAREVSATWKIPNKDIHVVPYPHRPDEAWLKISKATRTVKTISFFGGIKTFKGIDVLAHAIPLVLKKHPEIRFVFAGSPQNSPIVDFSLSAFVNGNICKWDDIDAWLKRSLVGFGSSVDFRGQLDRNGIAELLEQSDICVLPSRFDNFPNACLEAMVAARPVVATRSGGMEEMIGQSRGGLLVEPGNFRELAAALIWMIENPEERVKMAARGRAHVLSAYNDEVIGPIHEAYLAEAIIRSKNLFKVSD